jgi:hypothetical protein
MAFWLSELRHSMTEKGWSAQEIMVWKLQWNSLTVCLGTPLQTSPRCLLYTTAVAFTAWQQPLHVFHAKRCQTLYAQQVNHGQSWKPLSLWFISLSWPPLQLKKQKKSWDRLFFFPSLIKKYARIICALRPLTLSACNVAMKMWCLELQQLQYDQKWEYKHHRDVDPKLLNTSWDILWSETESAFLLAALVVSIITLTFVFYIQMLWGPRTLLALGTVLPKVSQLPEIVNHSTRAFYVQTHQPGAWTPPPPLLGPHTTTHYSSCLMIPLGAMYQTTRDSPYTSKAAGIT